MARRLSIHRATTVSPKSPICQVILKNTSATREGTNNASGGHNVSINRSQSLLTTNVRLPVLAPPRTERMRLEMMLSDVWSRDILPFPGLASRTRSEHLVRASSVMRKLSMASLTETFNKRSGSLGRRITAPAEVNVDDSEPPQDVEAEVGVRDKTTKRYPTSRLTEFGTEELSTIRRAKIQKRSISQTEQGTCSDRNGCELSGTVRRAKVESEEALVCCPNDSKEVGIKLASVQQKPSTTSLPLAATITPGQDAAMGAAKENDAEVSSGTIVGRWAMKGIGRSDSKAHGFRRLFR